MQATIKKDRNKWLPVPMASLVIIGLIVVVLFLVNSAKNDEKNNITPSNQITNTPSPTDQISPTASITQNPKSVSELIIEAQTKYESKDYAQAEISYKEVLLIEPSNEVATLGLAIVYDDWKKVVLAKQYYEKSITLNPKNPQTYLNLSQVWQDENNTTEAEKVLRRGLTANPGNEELQNAIDFLGIGTHND